MHPGPAGRASPHAPLSGRARTADHDRPGRPPRAAPVSRRVAIVGAGTAGLATAKAALEFGLEPVVHERSGRVGGLWRDDDGAVWPGLRTNISRWTCAFSDHPWPADAPDFPAAPAMRSYLEGYAERFGLHRHVVTGSEVTGRPPGADAVVVASGIFARPRLPSCADRFAALSLHSRGYRGPDAFAGRRVAVVGMSFSGAEIAAELAGAGVDVTLVVSRPAWVAPRYLPGPHGTPVPWDLASARRAPAPSHRERARALDDAGGNPGRFDPRLRLDPDSGEPPHVVFTDRLPDLVRDGRVAVAPGRVTGAGSRHLDLDDGTRLACDAVVWCTGYRADPPVPHLPGADRDDPVMPFPLDRITWHPDLPDHAFVGLYRGPHLAVVELQARWVCAVLAGAVPRPSPDEMRAGVAEALAIRDARPRPQFPYRDPVALGDRIAGALGVLPEPSDLRDGDPVVPAQYRLRGPGAGPAAARLAIDAARRRTGTA